jgi:hypothetical protein
VTVGLTELERSEISSAPTKYLNYISVSVDMCVMPLLNYITVLFVPIIIIMESVNLLSNGFLQSPVCDLTTITKRYYECSSEMHRNKTYTLV